MAPTSVRARLVFLGVIVLSSPPTALGDGGAKKERTDLYGDPLPAGAIYRIGTVRFRQAQVWRVAFSPDGKTIASGGSDNEVRLWDPETGRTVRRFRGHPESINCVAFSPDGKRLASGSWAGRFRESDKGEIRLWDVASGKQVGRLTGLRGGVKSIAFSPRGGQVASFSYEADLDLWDVESGRRLWRLTSEKDNQWHGIAFSPNGKTLVCGKELKLVDVATGETIRSFVGHEYGAAELAFSPDGKTLYTSSLDATIRFWDVATGKERTCLDQVLDRRHKGDPNSFGFVALAPDGKTLASGDGNGTIRIVETESGRVIHSSKANRYGFFSASYSPDGARLAVAAEGKSVIQIWDAATGKLLNPSPESQEGIWQVRFSPNGKLLACGPLDGTVQLWDTKTRQETRRIPIGGFSTRPIAFSRDGSVMSTASENGGFVLWDPETGKQRRRFDPPKAHLIGFSPVADLFAYRTGSELVLWDLANDRELSRQKEASYFWAFSPDGHTVAGVPHDTRFRDGRIILSDVGTGQLLHTLQKGQGFASSLAFSPDGWIIATAGGGQYTKDDFNPVDPAVILWECITGKERLRLDGHPGQIQEMAFSPDGRLLASTTHENVDVIRLWDVADGKLLGKLDGHCGPINSVAFSPDSKTLASAGSDTTVLLWDVAACIGNKPRPVEKRSPEQLATLISDLASDDAAKAYRAIVTLSDQPDRAVGLVKERIQEAADTESRVVRLVAELDADEFDVREKASADLARLGKSAQVALRKAAANPSSAEVRRRANSLLSKLKGEESSPETLVTVRSVEVLERIATPGARQLLQKLAAGAPEARLTQEAKATLERVEKRATAKP